jgi:SNF2 family DNA or RNA helicase
MAALYEELLEWSPECLVFDECHKLKDVKSKRTKKAITISDQAEYKFILSGTPILNTLLDIFTQYRVLDGGKSFGKNFFTFRAKYFYDANKGMPKYKYFPNWKMREGATDEVQKILDETSMHVKKEDCLDLPPLVKKTIYVEMSKSQKKMYDDMKQDFIATVEGGDGVAVAELAITKALRLQQIVSGYVPVEQAHGNRTIFKVKENNRAKALEELLREITPNAKVIVWAVFRENYAAIREVCEKVGVGHVELTGDISTADKQRAVDHFTSDDSCRVLIGHPGSAGIGVNLVEASYSIFYSRSFSLEYDIQAEGRNYRGGSERHEKITRIDLVTEGTIDELVLKSLASKTELSYQVLKAHMEEI